MNNSGSLSECPGGNYMFIENLTHDDYSTPAGVIYPARYGVSINIRPR